MAMRFIVVDIANSIAIARDVSIESPRVPERVVQVKCVRAHWDTVDGVVRAHNSFHLSFHYASLEGWQVVISHVSQRDFGVKVVPGVPVPALERIGNKVLAAPEDHCVIRVHNLRQAAVRLTLQTLNEVCGVISS